ncbi:MAG: pimeloyl-ACP methyl ester carboxylesterase [Acidimicrobiales bacterium]|jgi:pimeloyl-ACP methyl ester carboxylesterase
MWRGALPHLVGSFHCYGLDLRGHGACRPTDPNYSVDRNRMAEDVFAAAAAIGEGPIRFAAHSLGGAAGIFAAVRRPEAFHSLWLFEPVVIPSDFDRSGGPSMLVDAARKRRMHFDSVEDAFGNFMAKRPFSTCDPEAVRGYVEIGTRPVEGGGIRLTCEGEDEARVFEGGQPLDFAVLTAVTTPVLVASGANTGGPHAIPAAVAPLIASAIPSAVLQEHAGLTHFGPMEDPAAMASSVIAHCL